MNPPYTQVAECFLSYGPLRPSFVACDERRTCGIDAGVDSIFHVVFIRMREHTEPVPPDRVVHASAEHMGTGVDVGYHKGAD